MAIRNTGEQLKRQGQDDVLAAEYTIYRNWTAEAEDRLTDLIREGKPFTSDDLRERCVLEPHHHNAWGAFMSAARARGEIKPLGYVKPRRRQAHNRPIQQWVAA